MPDEDLCTGRASFSFSFLLAMERKEEELAGQGKVNRQAEIDFMSRKISAAVNLSEEIHPSCQHKVLQLGCDLF